MVTKSKLRYAYDSVKVLRISFIILKYSCIIFTLELVKIALTKTFL